MSPADWDQVRGIYEAGIATGNATFETDAPTWERWDAGHLTDHRLVAEVDGNVVGWVALSPVSDRCVYGGVAENSIYVDARARGCGIGRTLLDALEEFLASWRDQSGVAAELVLEPGTILDGLSQAAELQLLRIVQEALANVRKHAEAKHVQVRMSSHERELEVVIADDGRGFVVGSRARPNDDSSPHFGLSTMRERAESVGGSLEVESTSTAGTRVVVKLPLGAAVASAR